MTPKSVRLTQFSATRLTKEELEQFYGIPVLDAPGVAVAVKDALRSHKSFSLVRAGDVDAKALAHEVVIPLSRVRFAGLAGYAGLPKLPSPQLRRELADAVRAADVVGVLDLKAYWPTQLARQAFAYHRIYPKRITSALVMREMYLNDELMQLFEGYRLHIVGRQAESAAARLRKGGLKVSGWTNLEGYSDTERAYKQIVSADDFDVALIGAAVPGRLLCSRIAKARGVVALDIGHVVDEIVCPGSIGDSRVRSRLLREWRQAQRGG